MNNQNEKIPDKRTTTRITCQTPLVYKVCKEETISKLLEGYTQDISKNGLRCTITERIPTDCILWLKLDIDAINACEEIEKRAVIIQQGVLGKVMWVEEKPNNIFEIGLRFITREERGYSAFQYNI